MLRFLIVPLVLLVSCLPTLGHSWYPTNCCSDKDCHPIPCEELTEQSDGTITYKGMIFSKPMIKPSLDSSCHVCFSDNAYWGNPGNYTPYCVFTLQGF